METRPRELVASRRQVDASLAGWTGFGAIVVMVLASTHIGNVPQNGGGRWWFTLPTLGGVFASPVLWVLFYAALATMVGAWWQLGRLGKQGMLSQRQVVTILAAWCVPLLLGPPMFSGDMYSYAAQGTLAHEGLNPYQLGPIALAPGPLLSSVAPVWLYTPAPYGPLFLFVAKEVMVVFGGSVVGSVMVMRLTEMLGVVLLVRFLPRLAVHMGADPVRALWIGVLSPVPLFSLISSGHNDTLMVGFLVAGVALAMEDRPLAGVALCAVAMTIKLPAVAGVGFIGMMWSYRFERIAERAKVMAKSAAVTLIVAAAATWLAGLGWGWLNPSTLSTPTALTLAAAPVAAVGLTVANLLQVLGAGVATSVVVGTAQVVGAATAVGLSVAMLLRAKGRCMPPALAVSFLAVVLLGPVLWPWYLTWGLVLLAATRAQDLPALALMAVVAALIVLPDGSSIGVGPAYVPVAVLSLAVAVWAVRSGRWRSLLPELIS
ncbi:MAG: polyprenol phosphomannose-dependent alpha 1,6 mannosyltransferase MptB [Actinomycetota bacterium]|nr:polyprenol phosphomannose-dependent alpha 1,6 mannosyltransferase MptB [Actinomycetota bacterium]